MGTWNQVVLQILTHLLLQSQQCWLCIDRAVVSVNGASHAPLWIEQTSGKVDHKGEDYSIFTSNPQGLN